MELKDFIGKFVSQFEEEDPAIFEADLDFHELDSWSSLTSLSVVAWSIKNMVWSWTPKTCVMPIQLKIFSIS